MKIHTDNSVTFSQDEAAIVMVMLAYGCRFPTHQHAINLAMSLIESGGDFGTVDDVKVKAHNAELFKLEK